MKTFEASDRRARELGVDPSRGLSEERAAASRDEHGENRLPEPRRRSVRRMFLDSLSDKTLIVLMGAAALSLAVEIMRGRVEAGYQPRFIDGIAILCAVLIASLITTINEARAAKEFASLSRESRDVTVAVLRDGREREVSVHAVAVGDVVRFQTGGRLPADGRLLSGVDVRVDESMLTGESQTVRKDEGDLELRSGTIVTGGTGSMLVEAVGTATEAGRLRLLLTEERDDLTPLQERLSRLADRIGLFGVAAAAATFLALSVSGFARGQVPFALSLETGGELLRFLVVAVTIVVVAVPEGLPLAVTISLAYSVRKMAGDKNLVRRLASPETMGAATVICSDKTGTLTENRMTAVALWLGGEDLEPGDLPEYDRGRIADIAAIDSTAYLEETEDGLRTIGSPTEGALLEMLSAWGVDWRARREGAEVVRQFGFSSERKRMSTLVRDAEGRHRLLVKGAPEVLLELSKSAGREAALAASERFARDGRRTLGLAWRELGADQAEGDAEDLERDLEFLGLVAITDPVRPGVERAVADCRRAGLEVKMVTGDNRLTAEAVAAQAGMNAGENEVFDGSEEDIEGLGDKIFETRIFARVRPDDKYRLVERLMDSGEVVAVTGDGTNDAPALRRADVGLSMGKKGTEVAKEASDIVILDDNFASIVNGIRWGRSIFENIRKFLQFQLTVNLVAVLTAFLAAVTGFGIPLNTVQLLWVNLIMDTLAALALATEPPSDRVLDQPPHGRHAPLITRPMGASILVTGAVMLALLLICMWTDLLVPAATPRGQKLTFVFNAFVMMQIFNEVNARSTRFGLGAFRGLLKSRLFLVVVVVTLAAQFLIVQVGGEFFRTHALGPGLWLKSVLLGASMLPVGGGIRLAGRRLEAERGAN